MPTAEVEGPVLVTGADGFVGPFVLSALEARGLPAVPAGLGAAAAALEARLGREVVRFDLTDPQAVDDALGRVRPGAVVHLAAQSDVALGFRDPVGTHRVNYMGTVHLLDAVGRRSPGARLLFVSSAAVYGRAPPELMPLSEDAEVRPADPYAASKAAGEVAVLQAGRAGTLRPVIARPFNHTGPGQGDAFVCSTLARQVAAIRRGAREPSLRVGDLSARRDFSDVRDVARAYTDLLAGGEAGAAYNVCSGRSRAMSAVLEDLLRLSGVEVSVERDPTRLRPVDLPDLRGDGSRFRERFGWQPPPIGDATLLDLMSAWDRVDGAAE